MNAGERSIFGEERVSVPASQTCSWVEQTSECRCALSATSTHAHWRTSRAWHKHGSRPLLPTLKWTLQHCYSLPSLRLRYSLLFSGTVWEPVCRCTSWCKADGMLSSFSACTWTCICFKGSKLFVCLHVLSLQRRSACGSVSLCTHTLCDIFLDA